MTEEWQHVYLDTCLIQDCLWGTPDEEASAKSLMWAIKSASNANYLIEVKISFLVVGELINNLLRAGVKDKYYILEKFLDLLQKLKVDLGPPPEEAYNKAIDLRKEDYLIERVDALIVSQALCNPYSSHFLTRDPLLLKSDAIVDLEREMRESGDRKRQLRITEEF